MPKASSSTSALKRNQACKQCRKRKLKCDAQRPHCGTCVRTWTTQCAVPPPVGYAHPIEPACTYDPVEGLRPVSKPASDPSERVRVLETEISELRDKLREAQFELQQSTGVAQQGTASPDIADGTFPPTGITLVPSDSSYSPRQALSDSHNILNQMSSTNSVSNELMRVEDAEYDSQSKPVLFPLCPDPLMSLLFSGWNSDLPEPAVLSRLVDIYFRCDPCASRILHRPSLMASLSLPPTHSHFPHPAILHAICASASRWTSVETISIASDGTRRDRFAEYHAAKTRSYIDQTVTTGAQIFSVLQASSILSWYLLMEGRWVEVWIFAGFQTRVAVPLRLNYPGTHVKSQGGIQMGYLPPPKDPMDLELRRRAWWMSVVFDRLVSVGGWLHGIDERDIKTELPLRHIDFELERFVESNPQHLSDDSTLVVHPPCYTDSFILLIKACMLFGKVTDYTVRQNLHDTASERSDVRMTPSFKALDRLVTVDFLASLPQGYKNCLGLNDLFGKATVDTDLYLVHLIPHAATITLHNPFINLSSATDASARKCLDAARAILDAYYLFTSTSFSIKRLHPFTVICWYLAAVVQVHLCKRLIELGDRANEAIVWGEINALRMAMLEYGIQSSIGIHQEKLLQGLMAEILQMTSQAQPLKVGVPLYPFSHARVFPSNSTTGNAPDFKNMMAGAHIAPLLGASLGDTMDSETNGGPPAAPATIWNDGPDVFV